MIHIWMSHLRNHPGRRLTYWWHINSSMAIAGLSSSLVAKRLCLPQSKLLLQMLYIFPLCCTLVLHSSQCFHCRPLQQHTLLCTTHGVTTIVTKQID
jgi:hypothetical protein